MNRSMWRRAAIAASAVILSSTTVVAPAVPLMAVRADDSAIFFDSAAPASVTRTIAALNVPVNETIVGIDQRPATGDVFVVTYPCDQLYVLDVRGGFLTPRPTTCVPIGTPPPPAPSGVDFNPTVDRVRFVDIGGNNFRINPDTGAIVSPEDTPLTAGFQVTAVAYDRNVAGTTATTLYAIDVLGNQLVTIGGINSTPSPNGGVVTPIGPLGVDPTDASFEITGDGGAFAALNVGGTTGLYTINLSTGAATLIGPIGTGTAVVGLAGAPGIPPIPATSIGGLVLLALGVFGVAVLALRRRHAPAA